MFADGVGGVVHAVEGCDALDFSVGAVEPMGDFGDRIGAEESAVFALGDPECGEDARFFGGVVGFEGFELIDSRLRELEFKFFGSRCFGPLVYCSKLDEVAHRSLHSTFFALKCFGFWRVF